MNAEDPTSLSGPHGTSDPVRKTTRLYLMVGLILFCGTAATVAVATVPWLDVGGHGFDGWDAMLGIGIASFKAMLVAAVFMHLNHERRLIYAIAALAAFHAAGFFIGTYWHYADIPQDSGFYLGPIDLIRAPVGPVDSHP